VDVHCQHGQKCRHVFVARAFWFFAILPSFLTLAASIHDTETKCPFAAKGSHRNSQAATANITHSITFSAALRTSWGCPSHAKFRMNYECLFSVFIYLEPCQVSPLSPRHAASSGFRWREGLQILRTATNILNKHSRIDDKGWSYSLGLGVGLKPLTVKKMFCYEMFQSASELRK